MTTEAVVTECKFAVHIPIRSKDSDIPDFHMAVEKIFDKDKNFVRKNIRIIKDYKRPFYVTAPKYRNHREKKESEDENKLIRYECTESDLPRFASRALKFYKPARTVRDLHVSPYIYGSSINSTVFLKAAYAKKNDNLVTPFDVTTLDIETSVIPGISGITHITIANNKYLYCYVREDFFDGVSNYRSKVLEQIEARLRPDLDRLKLKLNVVYVKNEAQLLIETFKELHIRKPDFLAIWSLDFDIPKIVEAAERNGISPADLFSDPDIPVALRYYKYKQGRKFKVTSSGQFKPINPSAQWHTVISTSSFYVIDAMCVYRRLRLAKPELPNYKLDFILDLELKTRKLTFEPTEKLRGIEYHQAMQSRYKPEYTVYNIYDSLSMVLLDNKTKDLSIALPIACGMSDFADTEFQPRLIANDYYFYLRDNKQVLGTPEVKQNEPEPEESTEEAIDDELDEDEKKDILSLKGWIVNLASTNLVNNGHKCLLELPQTHTNIRTHTYDQDAVGAYPTSIGIANVSKATTVREIITIKNRDEAVFRLQNINIMVGAVNSVEYCVNMFHAPDLGELLSMYKTDHGLV